MIYYYFLYRKNEKKKKSFALNFSEFEYMYRKWLHFTCNYQYDFDEFQPNSGDSESYRSNIMLIKMLGTQCSYQFRKFELIHNESKKCKYVIDIQTNIYFHQF